MRYTFKRGDKIRVISVEESDKPHFSVGDVGIITHEGSNRTDFNNQGNKRVISHGFWYVNASQIELVYSGIDCSNTNKVIWCMLPKAVQDEMQKHPMEIDIFGSSGNWSHITGTPSWCVSAVYRWIPKLATNPEFVDVKPYKQGSVWMFDNPYEPNRSHILSAAQSVDGFLGFVYHNSSELEFHLACIRTDHGPKTWIPTAVRFSLS